MALVWVAAVATVATVGTGCASFDDPSTVKDLRVLAVAAEPSEIILNITSATDPTSVIIPPIALTPLIVDPRGGGRPVEVTVSACANDPGAQPPPNNGGDPGYPSGGARTTIGSALCDGAPTATSIAAGVDLGTNPSITAQLDPTWIASAFARDRFIGPDGAVHGGFDLGMPVVFQVTAVAGSDTVKTVKRAIFWAQPVTADQIPNVTPTIASVRVYDRRDETTAEPVPDAVQPLVDGTAALVPRTGLWVDPAPADAEPYVTAVLDRITGQVIPHAVAKETLTYSFYATAGTFSPFETSSEPPLGVIAPGRVHIESKYHPPPAAETPADMTIWIVVRDERGGASWVTRALHVEAP